MSFLQRATERAKQATSGMAGATMRGAQRGKLELEVKRLESKMSGEKDRIGQAVYPLLADGRLTVDLPEVADCLAAITAIESELAGKHAEIEALGKDDAPDESGNGTHEAAGAKAD